MKKGLLSVLVLAVVVGAAVSAGATSVNRLPAAGEGSDMMIMMLNRITM